MDKDSLLNSVFDHLDVAIFVVEPIEKDDYRFSSMNKAFEHFFHVSRTILLKNSIKELGEAYPNLMKKTYDLFQRCKKTGEHITEEYHVHVEHESAWLLINLKPVFNDSEELQHILGSATSINRQKQIEEELISREKELLNIQKITKIGSYRKNYSTGEFHFSDGLLDILGYHSQEEKENFTFETLFKQIHPEDKELYFSTMDDVLENNQKGYQLDFRIIDKQNNTRYIKAIGEIVYSKIKLPIQSLVTIQDITEQKQAELNVLEAKKTAEDANTAKSEFLASMSHEIRTPLNAVLGFTELLHDIISDEKQLSYLDMIKNSGNNLLMIINDVLDLSKLDAGKMQINEEIVNIPELVQEVCKMFIRQIREKEIELKIDFPQTMAKKVYSDSVRLRQILINLISNAIKFTHEGYVTIKLNYIKSNDLDEIDLYISVEDTGIGIPPEFQKKIFESFRQKDGQSAKQYGGTGLGLSISKKLAEIMGGKLKLFSEINKGSTFTVSFPKVRLAVGAGQKESRIRPEESDIVFEKASILIVDDIQSNRFYLKEMFLDTEINIIEAENGPEGISKAQHYKPDVILMDLKMHGMDGYAVLEMLKNDDELNEIPIIAISAAADTQTTKRVFDAGFDGFLTKPVRVASMIAELSRFIPYTSVSQHIEKHRDTSAEELKPIITENLATIKHELETLFLPQCKQLQKGYNINKIKDFTQAVKDFGNNYQIDNFTEWAEKLYNYTCNFDLHNIKKELHYFSDLVEEIQNTF